MLKILYKPTGNVFILPDEQVLEIMNKDKEVNYQVLDAGFQREGEEHLDEKTVAELLTGEKIEEKEFDPLVEDETGNLKPAMPIEQMDRDMVIALGKRLNLSGFGKNRNREKMVDILKEYFGE